MSRSELRASFDQIKGDVFSSKMLAISVRLASLDRLSICVRLPGFERSQFTRSHAGPRLLVSAEGAYASPLESAAQ